MWFGTFPETTSTSVQLVSVSDHSDNPLYLQLSPSDSWHTGDGLSTIPFNTNTNIPSGGGRQSVTLGITCGATVEALKEFDACALRFAKKHANKIWKRELSERAVDDMFSPSLKQEAGTRALLRTRMEAATSQSFTVGEVTPPTHGFEGVLNLHRTRHPSLTRGKRCLARVHIPHLWFSRDACAVPKRFGLTVEITHILLFPPEETHPADVFQLANASIRLHRGAAIESRASEAVDEIEKLLRGRDDE